jgi:ectoine hydroxylase-related dioxygenase (phytanoyl-CoA dioxygenase family)
MLTGEDLQRFESAGYLEIQRATSTQEIERVRAIVVGLLARRAGLEAGDYLDLVGDDREATRIPQILMPSKYAPELVDSKLHADAAQLAPAVLGDGVVSQGEHIIAKPAMPTPEVPLHQDEAFWGENTEYRSVSIWFPLQDTDQDNGCLHFVPGSHRLDVLPHRGIGGDRSNNGLELIEHQHFHPVSVPLRSGDATIHHCRTIHGSGPNRSGRPRYAYVFGFGLAPRRREQARDFPWIKHRTLVREQRLRESGREPTKMRPEH